MRQSPVDYVVEDRNYKSPCWIWRLKISRFGYGCIRYAGKDTHAHIFYYRAYRGDFPSRIDGQRTEVDHLCRVRECVNPDHLEPVAQKVNIRRGNVCHLKLEQVATIAPRYAAGESQSQIAKSLGIGQVQVGRILRGVRRSGMSEIVPGRHDRNLKLSPEQVIEIRHRASNGEAQRKLANEFGMGQSQISRIVRGEGWAKVAMTA